jgi:hypothetical protein
MENGSQPLRSVAAELALLFLRELEPRVADDPELLVSTEAVLSFGAIRHADPAQWEYWRAILEKYEKSDLIEYMLNEPVRAEDLEWESKADRLIRLAVGIGLELFHDPDQQGWVSVRVDSHWENHPVRSRAFQLFLLHLYYRDTGESPGAHALRAARTCSRLVRCSTEKSIQSTCGWPNTEAGSTSTSATAPGGRSRSMPRAGGWSSDRRPGSAARAARSRCPNPNLAAASMSCARSSMSIITAGY